MPISWNEIRQNAIRFSREWAEAFTSDRKRVEFLFALYERNTAPLLPAEKKGKRRGTYP